MQDMQTSSFVSKEIVAKSSNMSSFLKPFEDKSFGIHYIDVTRHNEIIKIYLEYIKFLAGFIEHYEIIHLSNTALQKYIEQIPIENAFTFYYDVDQLLNLGLQVFNNLDKSLFCFLLQL